MVRNWCCSFIMCSYETVFWLPSFCLLLWRWSWPVNDWNVSSCLLYTCETAYYNRGIIQEVIIVILFFLIIFIFILFLTLLSNITCKCSTPESKNHLIWICSVCIIWIIYIMPPAYLYICMFAVKHLMHMTTCQRDLLGLMVAMVFC